MCDEVCGVLSALLCPCVAWSHTRDCKQTPDRNNLILEQTCVNRAFVSCLLRWHVDSPGVRNQKNVDAVIDYGSIKEDLDNVLDQLAKDALPTPGADVVPSPAAPLDSNPAAEGTVPLIEESSNDKALRQSLASLDQETQEQWTSAAERTGPAIHALHCQPVQLHRLSEGDHIVCPWQVCWQQCRPGAHPLRRQAQRRGHHCAAPQDPTVPGEGLREDGVSVAGGTLPDCECGLQASLEHRCTRTLSSTICNLDCVLPCVFRFRCILPRSRSRSALSASAFRTALWSAI